MFLVMSAGCTSESQLLARPPAPSWGPAAETSTTASSDPRWSPGPPPVVAPCARPPSTEPIDLVVTREIPSENYGYEIRVGRMVDENADGVVDAADPQQIFADVGDEVWIVDGSDQVTLVPIDLDAWTYHYQWSLADLTSDPGVEAAGLYWVNDELAHTWYVIHSGPTEVARFALERGEGEAEPRIADLEGDGAPELLTVKRVLDARDASDEADLEVAGKSVIQTPLAADLDLDGVPEIVTLTRDDGVLVRGPSGEVRGACVGAHPPEAVAIGNLDRDDEGELVVASRGNVAICDADGTVRAEVDLDLEEADHLALGELDGDRPPEIVISGPGRIVVLDDDLSVRFDEGEEDWFPAVVADLDGDGYHEIVVRRNVEAPTHRAELLILDGVGTERGRAEVLGAASPHSLPVVADVDGDGLAEIVLAGFDGVQVVEDGANGGWSVPDAGFPWPGPDHFPGDRGLLGEVPPAAAWWTVPERNVWSGLPTLRHPGSACPW